MTFYTSLAAYYERIFPFREPTYTFMRRYLPDTGAVLDIGCGSGHYCGRLQSDGYRAVGIDSDTEMVAAAGRGYPAASFARLAMEDLDQLGSALEPGTATGEGDTAACFDGAYCIGNVAAHLPPAHWRDFLAELRRRLKPGAPWILQTVNFDAILGRESFRFPDLSFDSDEVIFRREYRDISPEQLRFLTSLRTGDELLSAGEVTLYPLPATRCIAAHETAGFACAGHFADFAGKPFDPEKFSGSVYVFTRSREDC